MKKFILAGAVAAMMIPASGFAQDANIQLDGAAGAAGGAQTNKMSSEADAMGATDAAPANTMGTTDTMGTAGTADTMGATDVAPGGAMGAGDASATADTSGSYTIVTKTSADNAGTNTGMEANRNTDPAAVQRTIDANPGLAEKLQAEGVMMDEIGSISVGPNGQVTVYNKS